MRAADLLSDALPRPGTVLDIVEGHAARVRDVRSLDSACAVVEVVTALELYLPHANQEEVRRGSSTVAVIEAGPRRYALTVIQSPDIKRKALSIRRLDGLNASA